MHHNVPTVVFEDPSKLADFVSVLTAADTTELQDVLECLDVEARPRASEERTGYSPATAFDFQRGRNQT